MIQRRAVKLDVNFINLIDVMLVLLIIFMMAAPTIQQWVDVDLPSSAASNAKITEGIVISVTKDGTVYIDKDKVPFEKFAAAFKSIWDKRSGEPIFIRADGEVAYQRVMDIIGTAKNLGGENVGLVVEETKTRAR
jgi:biopolymer transport protein TolR